MNKNLTEKQIKKFVRDFQLNSQSLEVDGIAGPKTIAELNRIQCDVRANGWVWPLVYPKDYNIGKNTGAVSDPFSTTSRGGRGHYGCDLAFKNKSRSVFCMPTVTPWYHCPNSSRVRAVAAGIIRSSKYSHSNGWYIKIDHGNGLLTVYRHLATTNDWTYEGYHVVRGEVIGFAGHAPKAGDKGFNHLHFEVWDTTLKGGKNNRKLRAMDPELFLPEPGP